MSKKTKKQKNSNGIISDDGFELIGGAAGKEMAIGEVVTGEFLGIVRTMPGKKKGTTVPFYQVGDRALLGSTVLKSRIDEATKLGKLTEGKVVRITRIEDGAKRPGMAPAKIFTLEVKRD